MRNRDPKLVKEAEDIFEKYFSLGAIGRSLMVISDVMRQVNYPGSDKSFHRFVWQPFLKRKLEESPEIVEQIKALKEEGRK